MSIADLPTVNAALNAIATVLLFLGWRAIKKKRPKTHIKCMISALVVSTVFLICYLIYHGAHGSTKYDGEGIARVVYFFILMTHIPLAALVVPACLIAVRHALKGRLIKHKRITKWLWPVWMYVSVTGVLIYVMLHVL